ncbi:MAG: hypothetical protein AAB407_02805 [Patescibacteria group bacterium]
MTKHLFLGIALLVLILWLGYFAGQNEFIREEVARFGYGGVFIASIIAGFNFIAPVPAISFLPLFIESGLQFWPTILIIIAGTVLADSVAYFVGDAARKVALDAPKRKIYAFLERFKTRPWIMFTILFFFAALVPLPNELIIVPMGFLGYRLLSIFPILIAGNAVFNLAYGTAILRGLFTL